MFRILVVALALGLAGPVVAQSTYGGTNRGYGGMGGSPNYGYGTGSNSSSHRVPGYTTRDGGYVQPHQQTNPNNTQLDNYNTRGNQNPYSGSYGTRTPRY